MSGAKHSAISWAMAGDAVPLLAALAVIPGLIHLLGTERFGLLSLFWAIGGYFSMFDLGLGRAVTISIADLHAKGAKATERLGLTGSALALLVTLGSIVSTSVATLFALDMVRLPVSNANLAHEAQLAFLVLLPTVPLQLVSAAIRGHLEGVGAFRSLNVVRIPLGILLSIGPYLCAHWHTHLVWATLSILLVRLIHCGALLGALARSEQTTPRATIVVMMRHAHRYQLVNLLRIGGWISLSSAIGPIIVYTDRFVIGFLLGGAAVSAYSVPFDLLSRFPLLIVSASYVLLPTLVNLSVSAVQDKRAAMSLWDTLRYATLAAVAFSASGVALGWLLLPYFLSWWVGPELSSLGVGPGQYLLVAFAVNAVTQIPLTCLYAMRETRVVAIIHLLEVGPYLLLLVWSVERYGVTGAAVACLCRAVADFVLLGVACHRKVNAHAAEQSV